MKALLVSLVLLAASAGAVQPPEASASAPKDLLQEKVEGKLERITVPGQTWALYVDLQNVQEKILNGEHYRHVSTIAYFNPQLALVDGVFATYGFSEHIYKCGGDIMMTYNYLFLDENLKEIATSDSNKVVVVKDGTILQKSRDKVCSAPLKPEGVPV
jgi:hypothetical protein